ncbi:MAG: hypothetical protein IKM54_04365, partial [Butyricicoccus sp.]|nr:hypothetical protein [Butyricicoccus sp.]
MKMGKKRLLSLLMAVVMLFTIVSFSAFAVDRTVTVTVTDKDGDRIEGAEVRIYRTRYGSTETVESGTTAGNGQLTLTYDRR